jgi:SAM-dependent methyltransferase
MATILAPVAALADASAARARRVDAYDIPYDRFADDVYAAVRREAFGVDIGQHGWLTADELARWADWLALPSWSRVLDVACGSGGPSLALARRTGARVIGVDVNPHGIGTARRAARLRGMQGVSFELADADEPLPFDDASFDAVVCIDAISHLRDWRAAFRDWRRLARPGARLLFTDPAVITGTLTSEELAMRTAIGHFTFVPADATHRMLAAAGFTVLDTANATANEAAVARRWHAARASRAEALVALEGRERYEGLQAFLSVVHRLAEERRLSRLVYLAEAR